MTPAVETPAQLKRPALRYYGAKWRLSSWIIRQFPRHGCYVEPYAGTGAVLMRKPRVKLEVFNDSDLEIVNFFRVLREQPEKVLHAIRYTPYSRFEFDLSYEAATEPIERARRFFVRSWQGYGGPRIKRLTGWKYQARHWESGRADQVNEWNDAKSLEAFVARLEGVQLECDDALKVIARFDTEETLFYCDPPYPSSTWNKSWNKDGYTHEIDAHHHVHLSNLLHRIKGMAAISTYPNPLYDEMFGGWQRLEKTCQTMNKSIATELLYLSPALTARRGV